MIPLDQNYKDTPPQEGGFERPPAGGYIFKCLAIEEAISKNGNPMVVFDFDIIDGEHTGAFSNFPVKYYQLCTGEQTGRFKGVLKAFHESNNNMPKVIANNQFNPMPLLGLIIGGNLREEEYMKDGKIKTSMKIAYLCPIIHVQEGKVKPLDIKKVKEEPQESFMGGEYQMPPGGSLHPGIPSTVDGEIPAEDDLPF